MSQSRIIRIQNIDYDWPSTRYRATAICRETDGVLSRIPLSVQGDPGWSHGRAMRALERAAGVD